MPLDETIPAHIGADQRSINVHTSAVAAALQALAAEQNRSLSHYLEKVLAEHVGAKTDRGAMAKA